MQKAHDELVNKKIGLEAKRTGDKFPGFNLKNHEGDAKKLDSLFEENKFLVVSFYRGGWCPYCNIQLKALQEKLSEFKELSAGLVTITPETPDNSLSTAQKNEIAFDILSDVDSSLAKELGISFELPENLRPLYTQFGIDIPKHNGKNNYTLPIPATYLIDRDGTILFDFLNLNYTVRSNPEDIVNKLKTLNQ